MSTAERRFHLDVSEYFFRLTTESIRLHSNRLMSYSTLTAVVNDRAANLSDLPHRYDSVDLLEHLRIIPSDGTIRLEFEILDTSSAMIADGMSDIAKVLRRTVKFADAISLMLYDYVVETNATEVLTKLGMTSEEADSYRVCLKKSVSNIIPFK